MLKYASIHNPGINNCLFTSPTYVSGAHPKPKVKNNCCRFPSLYWCEFVDHVNKFILSLISGEKKLI